MLADQLPSTALVVAHPDDEILWFSSVLERIGHVFVCYLDVPGREDWTTGRRAVAENFPLKNVTFFGLTEAVSFRGADWRAPIENDQGLELEARPGTLPGFSPERYLSNFQELVRILRQRLDGYQAVVTHNPWGEYGNEEHVQVYRAVAAVREKLDFELWYSNYCSDRAYALMLRHIDGRRTDCERLPTNLPLAQRIERLYRKHDCWTWPFDDYAYFPDESFIRAESEPAPTARGSTIPLNYIKLIDAVPAGREDHGRFGPRSLMRRAYRWIRRRIA